MTLPTTSPSVPRPMWGRYTTISAALLALLLLPHVGDAYNTMALWEDQSRYMHILDLVSQGKTAEALDLNYMGPTYVAAAQAMKLLFSLRSIGALVLLNRLSVALAIVLPLLVYARRRDASSATIAATMVIVFALSTPFLYTSSIPWSHYFFGLLGIAFLLLLDAGDGQAVRLSRLFALGVLWGLMATTRLFGAEAVAGLVAAYLVLAFLRGRWRISARTPAAVALALLGAAAGYASHAPLLGAFHIYRQYDGMLDFEAYHGTLLNFRDLPVKFVQFFFDPCFYSLCKYVDYAKPTPFVFEADPGLANWHMPFALQDPFLLSAILLGILLLIRRPSLFLKIIDSPRRFVAVGVAVGVPLAYISYLVGGAEQLKHGFVRELFFPSLAILVAVIDIAAPGILKDRERRFVLIGLPIMAIVLLQAVPYYLGFPRFPGTHIARVTAAQACANGSCSLSLQYYNVAGDEISIPFDRYARIKVTCADGTLVSNSIVKLADYRFTRPDCSGGYKIVGLSTTTGVSRMVDSDGVGGKVVGAAPAP